MLLRKVLRRASRAGDGVGWKTGRGPWGGECLLDDGYVEQKEFI